MGREMLNEQCPIINVQINREKEVPGILGKPGMRIELRN